MDLTNLFRGLIILQFLCTAALVIVLPGDGIYGDEPFGYLGLVLLVYWLLFFLSLLLIFMLRPFGKTLFTFVLLMAIPVWLALPEPVIPKGNLADAVYWLGGVLDGAMLTMLYVTNLKEKFIRRQERGADS